jgi:hypothetical protein
MEMAVNNDLGAVLTRQILKYLSATDAERLAPPLESFMARAVDRLADTGAGLGYDPSIALGLLIEAWLVANPNEQPLWPKDYDDNTKGNDHTTGRAFYLTGGSTRPDWMKRKWV